MVDAPDPQGGKHGKPPKRHWEAESKAKPHWGEIATLIILAVVGAFQIGIYFKQASIMQTQADMPSFSIVASPKRSGEKRTNGPPPQPSLPAVRHAIVNLITRPLQRCPHCRKSLDGMRHKSNLPIRVLGRVDGFSRRGFNFPAHRNLRVSEGVENLLW